MDEATKELVNDTIMDSKRRMEKLRRRIRRIVGALVIVICCLPLLLMVFSGVGAYLIDGAEDLDDALFGLGLYILVGGFLFVDFSAPILLILGTAAYWRKRKLTFRYVQKGNRIRTIVCEIIYVLSAGWLIYNVGGWIWNSIHW